MTLEDIDDSLPNGFHDAEIKSILVDYTKRRVTIEAAIWVSEGPDNKQVPLEAYRLAEVVVEGLQFLAMDPPDPRYPFSKGDDLWVDLSREPRSWTLPALDALPRDCFVSRFFVNEWNAFIYVAAKAATLTWKGEMYDRSAVDQSPAGPNE